VAGGAHPFCQRIEPKGWPQRRVALFNLPRTSRCLINASKCGECTQNTYVRWQISTAQLLEHSTAGPAVHSPAEAVCTLRAPEPLWKARTCSLSRPNWCSKSCRDTRGSTSRCHSPIPPFAGGRRLSASSASQHRQISPLFHNPKLSTFGSLYIIFLKLWHKSPGQGSDLAHGPGVGSGLLPRLAPPTCSRPVSGVGLGLFCSFLAVVSRPLLAPCFSNLPLSSDGSFSRKRQ